MKLPNKEIKVYKNEIMDLGIYLNRIQIKKYKLVIIVDRKFCTIELAHWLRRQDFSFVLSQKQDTKFREKSQKFQLLESIEISPVHKFYCEVNFTLKRGFGSLNLAVYWKRKYRNKQQPEPRY